MTVCDMIAFTWCQVQLPIVQKYTKNNISVTVKQPYSVTVQTGKQFDRSLPVHQYRQYTISDQHKGGFYVVRFSATGTLLHGLNLLIMGHTIMNRAKMVTHPLSPTQRREMNGD